MLAYNHGEYIGKAIESILMQESNFDVEIVIGEDMSQDNTREIIVEYQKKYPQLIKPIFRAVNVGSTQNFYETLMACEGEYITCLEGDDYWTDHLKLKKQVEFLELNSSYLAVGHRNFIVDKNGMLIDYSDRMVPTNKRLGKKELMKFTTNLVHPSAMCYRNIFRNSDEDYSIIASSNKFGSHFMMLALLINKGPFFMMEEDMSAWRMVVEENATNFTSMANRNPIMVAENYFEMLNNFKIYFSSDYDFTLLFSKHFASSLFKVLKFTKNGKYEQFKKFSEYVNTKEKIISIYYFIIKGFAILKNKIKKKSWKEEMPE